MKLILKNGKELELDSVAHLVFSPSSIKTEIFDNLPFIQVRTPAGQSFKFLATEIVRIIPIS